MIPDDDNVRSYMSGRLRRASYQRIAQRLRLAATLSNVGAFGHKGVDCYRAAAILMLNAFVLLVGVQLAAMAILRVSAAVLPPTRRPANRQKVSYYASTDWAARYWYEDALSGKRRYHSYVGWRRAPFNGTTIEIDERGVRLTPGADCGATSFKVFAFGSSELWGVGSPNWETIPAHLQKGLERLRRGPVCVTNFAEAAYVSTQDVITLMLQLRAGNVPDVVLFYSIGGDVYSAYQTGRAGVSENLDRLTATFEKRQTYPFLDRLRSTYSYELIDKLMKPLTTPDSQQGESSPRALTYASMGIDATTLSARVVQSYFGNYEIVESLAAKYGFKYFFFLPPRALVSNKPLTPEEQEIMRARGTDPALSALYTAVYHGIERESTRYQNFYSLVHVFDDVDSLLWIDQAHVTPVGNRLVAARLLDIIRSSACTEAGMSTPRP